MAMFLVQNNQRNMLVSNAYTYGNVFSAKQPAQYARK